MLYVLDPGPDGSLGDVSWLIEAKTDRHSSRSLIYQGVLPTELSQVADVVLPGAAWVEKDATYTNDQGLVQAASKVHEPTRRSRRRLADPHQRRRLARSAVHLHELAGGPRATWRAAMAGHAGLRRR